MPTRVSPAVRPVTEPIVEMRARSGAVEADQAVLSGQSDEQLGASGGSRGEQQDGRSERGNKMTVPADRVSRGGSEVHGLGWEIR